MAMNPYFPASYMPYQYQPMPQYQPQAATQSSGGLIWVQGIEGAKAHPVQAGQSVLLMDSDSNSFFIKSADMSGMPLPLRIFDYTERNTAQNAQKPQNAAGFDVSAYITRDEFETRIAQICGSQTQSKREVVNDGE